MNTPNPMKVLLIVWVAVLASAVLALKDDQSRMETLVSTFVGCQDSSWTSANPVCDWAGVYCQEGSVYSFVWIKQGCSGTLDLSNLPENMLQLDIRYNNFSTRVDLTALPQEFDDLELYGPDMHICGSGDINHECNYVVSFPTQCSCVNATNYECPPC